MFRAVSLYNIHFNYITTFYYVIILISCIPDVASREGKIVLDIYFLYYLVEAPSNEKI